MHEIPALDGVDRLVGTIDALCADPVGARDLPVIIVDENDGDETPLETATAEAFVLGFRQRLLDGVQSGLLPHALLDRQMLAAVERASESDVDLLDRLAQAWQDTMPRSSGRLKLTMYRICRDVLTAPVGIGQPNGQRDVLAATLTAAWQRRTPGLRLLRGILDTSGAGIISQTVISIVSFLIGEPLQWVYRLRLDRTRRLRWYTEQVSRAGRPSAGFISAAVHMGEKGILRDNVALRQKLLIEALAMDLRRAAKHRLLLPSRRRRVWSFVLLLEEIGDLDSPARRMLEGWSELKTRVPNVPVLIVAGHAGPFVIPGAPEREPKSPRRATEDLQRYLIPPTRSEPARRLETQILIRLPEGPELTAVRDWLDTNVEARPRRVTWASVYLGWVVAAVTVIVVAGAVRFGYPLVSPCRSLWSVGAERVGIDTASSGCYFASAELAPLLHQVQDRIYAQNAEAMESENYKTVVFVGPVTTDPTEPGQLMSSGLLQLQGAAEAQERFNNAPPGTHAFKIRLLLANPGHNFVAGDRLADRLNDLVTEDKTVMAVIGVGQSRAESVNALRRLKGIAIIGAATTGDFMAEQIPRYFGTQPPNKEIAQAMTAEMIAGGWTSALIIHSQLDGYSVNLYDDLGASLKQAHLRVAPAIEYNATTAEEQGQAAQKLPEIAEQICEHAQRRGLAMYLGRSDELPKLLATVQMHCSQEPGDAGVAMLASDDITKLMEYPGLPDQVRVNKYTGTALRYVSFSSNGDSQRASGSDALDAAAAVIARAMAGAGSDLDASNVLQQLNSNPVEVDSGLRRPPFEISADARVPVGRGTLFVCEPNPDGLGSRSCTPRSGIPPTPAP